MALSAGVAVALAPAIAVIASSEGLGSGGRAGRGSLSSYLEGLGAEPVSPAPPVAAPEYLGADGRLVTVGRIRTFLVRRGSPLADYANDIVQAGVRHGVDPRVVVAIAGVETAFGARAAGFNAWGWARRHVRWHSWEQAIDEFTRGLASGYRSLRTGRFARASRSYCPPCGDRWGRVVGAIFRTI